MRTVLREKYKIEASIGAFPSSRQTHMSSEKTEKESSHDYVDSHALDIAIDNNRDELIDLEVTSTPDVEVGLVGYIRLSHHVYNTEQDYIRLRDAVLELTKLASVALDES